MLNQAVLVGRIKYISPDFMDVAVFNSSDKEKYDLITVSIPENISKHANEYCTLNDLVGIKGKLANKDGKLVVVADKMTFLSSTKGGD